MGRAASLALLLAFLPTLVVATTSNDLRPRITIDGDLSDFEADEWIVDDTTPVRERPHDSRWGDDNDIRRVAVTWDDYNLYVGLSAVTLVANLMVFCDVACGGVSDLFTHAVFRRNIEFGGVTPDLILEVSRASPVPRAGFGDCLGPFNLFDPASYASRYVQDGIDDGALEIAVPWEFLGAPELGVPAEGRMLVERGQTIDLLAAITGSPGTGAGDAAPDPTAVLENDSTRVAVLDNYVRLPLDANGDGVLDVGVSPRAVASYGQPRTTGSRQVLSVEVVLGRKVFAPDQGEVLPFRVLLEPADYDLPVLVTARVYASSGRLLRSVLEDAPRDLSGATTPVWDEWDGRDNEGRIVPAGVYILAVSGGPGGGAKSTTRVSCAVIR